MGIKLMTLAAHAASGKSIYVESVRRHAHVFFAARSQEGKLVPSYELEFVGAPHEGRFPVMYDVVHQGHIITNNIIDEGLVEENRSFTRNC